MAGAAIRFMAYIVGVRRRPPSDVQAETAADFRLIVSFAAGLCLIKFVHAA